MTAGPYKAEDVNNTDETVKVSDPNITCLFMSIFYSVECVVKFRQL